MFVIIFDLIIQIVIYVLILMIITLVAFYLLGIFRDNSLQQDQDVDKELNYFRELREAGKLSDVEFRIIKGRFSEIISEGVNRDANQNVKLNYKDPFLFLVGVDNSAAMDDTVIAGRSECNNKNGQTEYIETETKREKEPR
ncbi:MAG: hypothetical protein LBP59_12875 [Planctomycetaceae bacterium]|jgi:hypothetical protein|nr:hypothetical protein [Planctomycetaceae bacterium]